MTPVTHDLPGELLHRLPEWCVYIELGRMTSSGFVHGVWARIGFDTQTREEELDLLSEVGDHLVYVRRPLVGTLEDSLLVSLRDARHLAGGDPVKLLQAEMAHVDRRAMAEPILSVVLYLCSANAEIRASGERQRPTRPTPRRRASGELRWPGASAPTIWETGTRLGAALRCAQDNLAELVGEGTGSSVRPHVRRAHWHACWVGAHESRARVARTSRAHESPARRREVRWLPPIRVNLDQDEVPDLAAIRPARRPSN